MRMQAPCMSRLLGGCRGFGRARRDWSGSAVEWPCLLDTAEQARHTEGEERREREQSGVRHGTAAQSERGGGDESGRVDVDVRCTDYGGRSQVRATKRQPQYSWRTAKSKRPGLRFQQPTRAQTDPCQCCLLSPLVCRASTHSPASAYLQRLMAVPISITSQPYYIHRFMSLRFPFAAPLIIPRYARYSPFATTAIT